MHLALDRLPELPCQGRRQRLATHQELAQGAQRPGARGIGHQHAGHRRRALQVSDAVAGDLLLDRQVRGGWQGRGGGPAALLEHVQPLEARQGGLDLHAEIDQAGDLVDTRPAQPAELTQAGVGSAEQARGREVAVEGEVEQELLVLRGERLDVDVAAQAAGEVAHQPERAAQIAAEGLAHGLPHPLQVVAQEGVEHQGDVPLSLPTGFAVGGAVDGDLRRQLLQALAQEVGQQARLQVPGEPEGLLVAGRREPDRKLALERPGMDPHRHLPADAVGERNGLPRHSRRTVSMPAIMTSLRRA